MLNVLLVVLNAIGDVLNSNFCNCIFFNLLNRLLALLVLLGPQRILPKYFTVVLFLLLDWSQTHIHDSPAYL
jgi:hypothetical protein